LRIRSWIFNYILFRYLKRGYPVGIHQKVLVLENSSAEQIFLSTIPTLSPFQRQSSGSEKEWMERQETRSGRRQDDESMRMNTQKEEERLPAQRMRVEEEEDSVSFVSGLGTDSGSGSKLRQDFPSHVLIFSAAYPYCYL